MPRKTDGLPFEVHRSPHADEDGGIVLYATPLSNRRRLDGIGHTTSCPKPSYCPPKVLFRINSAHSPSSANTITLLSQPIIK